MEYSLLNDIFAIAYGHNATKEDMKKFITSLIMATCLLMAMPGSSNAFASVIPERNNMDEVTIIKDSKNADGVRTIVAKPSNVCSRLIEVSVKDGKVLKVTFTGGCSGNTQGVATLVEGMTVKEVIKKLQGIDCGGRGTSCPDQLSKVMEYFL